MKNTVFPSTKTDVLAGPLKAGQVAPKTYQPVDCDFTDELEFLAVFKIKTQVSYRVGHEQEIKTEGTILDVQSGGGEEVLVMSGGERIRLDYLVRLKILD